MKAPGLILVAALFSALAASVSTTLLLQQQKEAPSTQVDLAPILDRIDSVERQLQALESQRKSAEQFAVEPDQKRVDQELEELRSRIAKIDHTGPKQEDFEEKVVSLIDEQFEVAEEKRRAIADEKNQRQAQTRARNSAAKRLNRLNNRLARDGRLALSMSQTESLTESMEEHSLFLSTLYPTLKNNNMPATDRLAAIDEFRASRETHHQESRLILTGEQYETYQAVMEVEDEKANNWLDGLEVRLTEG